jgi:hypothetical protein
MVTLALTGHGLIGWCAVDDDTFEGFRAVLDKRLAETSEALRKYPRGPLGLPLEAVRVMPEYQAARKAYAAAHEALRQFNRQNSTHARRLSIKQRDQKQGLL